jgi:hypothetical protein
MPTKHGKHSTDSLGRDASGPLKAVEMDRERTRPKTVADGVSLADVVDCNSNEVSNHGLAATIKRRR